MLTTHGRTVMQAVVRELATLYGDDKALSPLGVSVMSADNWWTAAAIARTDAGWVAASTYTWLGHEPERPSTMWRHSGLADLTSVYLTFRDRHTHNLQRRTGSSEPQMADVTSISHRGLLHLLAGVPEFDREAAVLLAAMGGPDTQPQTIARWNPPLNYFSFDPVEHGLIVRGDAVRAPTGERCWFRWIADTATGAGEVLDGYDHTLGKRTLGRLVKAPGRRA